MAGFLLAASAENQRSSCGVNAALVNAASASAARTAAKAARPPRIAGEISDALLDAWSATQVSASDLTLIGGAAINWIEGSVPDAGLALRGA
jgi:hypothetical protein